jgi:hypothetical protein
MMFEAIASSPTACFYVGCQVAFDIRTTSEMTPSLAIWIRPEIAVLSHVGAVNLFVPETLRVNKQ